MIRAHAEAVITDQCQRLSRIRNDPHSSLEVIPWWRGLAGRGKKALQNPAKPKLDGHDFPFAPAA
jgi:hypothetical protein